MTRTGTADDALLLDNQLCFLVYRLHRAITDVYRPVLADLGLTYPQYLVMLVMWESQPLTVSQLGERLQLDSGTLSPLLKRLEGAGLIERTRSTKDERSVEVSLTRQGKRLRESARKVPSMIGECLAASPDEYWDVREQLTSMLARVESASSA
jgi:MarR family transcriptional regulator, organic hydroperoxide resistance regulator